MPESHASNSPPAPAETPTLVHTDSGPPSPATLVGRSLGNYDLLEEIGRGGMGVVFKARHRTLNRVVALKMILSGQLASADDVRRFRTEAEATALLDHSNIVPVYEVGEEGGQHFFACKLIEGGSLIHQIPRLVQGANDAARLLAMVARAVAHAHERGVLHRDLKPANILLDSLGAPHVADFGLARRAGDAGQTQSGAIVGTPGYMAPEQARAEKTLTTAADVYSLGAILYECLTGQPPFQADTALETILLVIEKEPVPPSALNRKVDPELEAVCLKCLAKEPASRYKSAAALADDLDQWLAGGAVSARPPSTLGRVRQWLRKEFRAAALTILAGCVVGILYGVSTGFSLIDGAIRTSDLYATSFPSEKPPLLASRLALRWFGTIPLDSAGGWPLWLMSLLLLVLPTGGLLNSVLSRPRTLATALSSGLGCGLVACVVALFLGFGFVQTGSPAFGALHSDIELMASGSRAESLERQASRNGKESTALREWTAEAEKHRPDLFRASLAPEERARVLADKIVLDLRMNLPVVIWFCVTVNSVLIFIPVVCQTILARALAEQGDRGGRFFLHYLEVAVPGSMMLVVSGIIVSGFVLNQNGAVLGLLALLGWFVLSALLWDQVLRWPPTTRNIVIGAWLLVGLGLAAWCLQLWITFTNSLPGHGVYQQRFFTVLGLVVLLTGAAIYGIFVKRWRWYVRFALYLGHMPIAATVLYFVMR